VVYHEAYSADLPAEHRFPMGKFRRLKEHLLATGLVAPWQVHTPEPAPRSLLAGAHEAQYVDAVLERRLDVRAERRIGFPVTRSVVARSRAAVAGTLLTARLALANGIACNLAGGSHHAFAGHGTGYCVFNDVAVAAGRLLAEGVVSRVLVVDLDVHQGDGTAAMCAHDPRIFTFSMHCESNFPARKQRSDRDVTLPPGLDDDGYLLILKRELPALLTRVAPQLVFYNAGVDPHGEDRLGRLALTDEGLARRERLVLSLCRSAGIPVAGVLGGGYSHDLDALVARHALMFEEASRVSRGD
jgi:acetoin utilization deacetylase AcuC-like enzyme